MARIDDPLELTWGSIAGDDQHSGAIPTPPRVAPKRKNGMLVIVIALSLLLCGGFYTYGRGVKAAEDAAVQRLTALQNAVAHRDDYIASIEASLTASEDRVETLSTRLEDSEIAAVFYKEQATSATIETLKAGQ
jgi:hypothetical protein